MANVGYINGFPDGTYRPNEAVTANQLCQIMLNILGYDIDTTVSWATAVQAKSFSIGLLKNVSGTVGSACSRQEAAQIIFNALTMNILETNLQGVKVATNETILSKYLNGYVDTVVVTGNEYASLTDSEPTDAGKTEVDGDTILNWTTGRDEIGSSYVIWATKGGAQKNDTVVYSELSADNAYYETHEATKTDGITAKDAGMKLTGADEYVNFAKDYTTTYTAEIRISYVYDEDDDGDLTDETIKTIPADGDISSATLTTLETIFKTASYDTVGYVTIGTKNVNADNDISNSMKWSAFKADYIKARTADTIDAKVNENGNYIKVIDNDGDGVADYILKTEYVMAVIKNISSKGVYTLSTQVYNTTTQNYVDLTVKGTAISTEDELAAGDVIVYALIDGVYYANLADIETITIAKKGIDFKAATITDGETTYGQSGIAPANDDNGDQTEFDGAFSYDDIIFSVTKASAEYTYDLYLDNYGYVRALTENKYTNGLGLLTDAYFGTDKRTNTVKVNMVTADTEATDYDVEATDSHTDLTDIARYANFINTTEADSGNRGTWDRLYGFNASKDTDTTGLYNFKTNVASYVEDDGTVTLYDPAAYSNRTIDVVKEELSLTSDDVLSTRKYATKTDATVNGATSKTVYATTDTVYYYVTNAGKSNVSVVTWTGYANAPKGLTLDSTQGDHAYAVATKSKDTGSNYYYANVIVIEAQSADTSLNFVYYANTNGTQNSNNTTSYWLYSIALDEDGEVDTAAYVDVAKGTVTADPDFYTVTGNKIAAVANYASKHIYAAEVLNGASISKRDYVDLSNGTQFRVGTGNVPVYALTKTNEKAWVKFAVEEVEAIAIGDQLIYVTDGKNVLYAIDVTQSAAAANLDALYTKIDEEEPAAASLYETAVKLYNDNKADGENTNKGVTKATKQAVLTAINDALADNTITEAQELTLRGMRNSVNQDWTTCADASITKVEKAGAATAIAANTTDENIDYDLTVPFGTDVSTAAKVFALLTVTVDTDSTTAASADDATLSNGVLTVKAAAKDGKGESATVKVKVIVTDAADVTVTLTKAGDGVLKFTDVNGTEITSITAKQGETVQFKLVVADNYKLSSVQDNSTTPATVYAVDGVYSYTIADDATSVEITATGAAVE
jgi:hypothetical protein